MRLVAFSVRNYRSIIEAYKLSLGNYTVLVGPNNEGKSNILKAIALSLRILTRSRPHRTMRRTPTRYSRTGFTYDYDWQRDFPVSLQEHSPSGRSQFTLEFELTSEDFHRFQQQVGVNLSTNLKITQGFGPEDVIVDILMKGPGKKALNNKREEVAEFIRSTVAAEYVSAIRPSEMALEIVDNLIEGELATLEEKHEYKKLMQDLKALQQPILDNIAGKLKNTVSQFVPGVKNIHISNDRMAGALRSSFNIFVDDGAKTKLSSKGDGIISLTTMSLMKHLSEEGLGEKSLILSIEEPESLLHPEAIHGLRKVLKDISIKQQVIITTHSPILVEREHIGQNVLVENGRAEKAEKIEEIRNALGIKIADNLVGAYVVLLVEGEEDRDILSVWLKSRSPALRSAMDKQLLIIDHLGGATNLHYKVSFYKQNVYNIHAFMDNDDDGRNAIEGVLSRSMLTQADYNLSVCPGMKDSELEDLFSFETYAPKIHQKFGVQLSQAQFKSTKTKWSDRTKKAFEDAGKVWNKSVKMQVKRTAVDACISCGMASLIPHRSKPIDNLILSLETKMAVYKI